MSDEVEDPEEAADRLEAALERIARLSASGPAAAPHAAPAAAVDQPETDLSIPEIAQRLDSLIARLRAALGSDVKP
jgi:3-oxoacyl-ACP reductase-like protein